jgi:hypothetical protein
MCFSAQASFIASGALLFIGILTTIKVKSLRAKNITKKLIPLTLIPYFFGIQQFAEGMLWVILTNHTVLKFKNLAMYTFLFFAYIFWPLFMPFALINLETKAKEKKILFACLFLGVFVSGYNIFYLFYYGSQAHIESHHICYKIDLTSLPTSIDLILYWAAAVLPFFISSVKYMRLLGISITVALIFTYVAYLKFFTSVWCFFGAILSVLVYLII